MKGKLSVIAVSQLMDKIKNEAVKESWRFVYRELRSRRDEETALMFIHIAGFGLGGLGMNCGIRGFEHG